MHSLIYSFTYSSHHPWMYLSIHPSIFPPIPEYIPNQFQEFGCSMYLHPKQAVFLFCRSKINEYEHSDGEFFFRAKTAMRKNNHVRPGKGVSKAIAPNVSICLFVPPTLSPQCCATCARPSYYVVRVRASSFCFSQSFSSMAAPKSTFALRSPGSATTENTDSNQLPSCTLPNSVRRAALLASRNQPRSVFNCGHWYARWPSPELLCRQSGHLLSPIFAPLSVASVIPTRNRAHASAAHTAGMSSSANKMAAAERGAGHADK